MYSNNLFVSSPAVRIERKFLLKLIMEKYLSQTSKIPSNCDYNVKYLFLRIDFLLKKIS